MRVLQPDATGVQDAAGDGKDIASLFGGKFGRDERAAAFARLYNDNTATQAADDAVARWESYWHRAVCRGGIR